MHDVCLDIETRSKADLPAVGAYRYAADPSTDIFMAAVSNMDDLNAPVYLWVNPKFEDAGVKSEPKAIEMLRAAKRVHAHNAPFEQSLCHGTNFEPFIALDQWRCTQAMARIAGLPPSLEACGDALDIPSKKDKRGKDLIKHFSMPQEDGSFNEPRDHREKWAQFCEYCRQDVRAEKQIYHALRRHFDLVGDNLETFLFTMRMNDTGIPVNVPALQNAKKIIDEVSAGAIAEFRKLTGLNITQRAKVLAWLQNYGLDIDNMQAETLKAVDLTGLKPNVARVLTLYCQLSYAATKKIETMLDWVCPDGRLHGVMNFYGAGTGRWSAGGPQIQNAKKPTPHMRPITHAAYKYVAEGGTAEGLNAVYGDPIEVLASCIRHFIHLPGSEMLDGDYNAIEARIICWSAGQKDILRMWRDGRDLYRYMASIIYGVPESRIQKGSDERDMGKRAELGCSYGLGPKKFKETCEKYGVPCSEALAERAVQAYRDTHPEVVRYWRMLEQSAKNAIYSPGTRYGPFHCQYVGSILYLFFRLPSGRHLAYPHPAIERDPEWGTQITYWGQLSMSTQWGRIKLYGGKLAENETQAIAADIMSFGARQAEKRWMMPFALIHDQGLAVRLGNQTAEDFASALATLPPWARELPLKVEAKIAPYYSK